MNEHGFDCREIEASLPLFTAGELEPAARDAVERHVAGCAPCSGRSAAAARSRVALIEGGRALGASAPDLWPGVRAALVAEELFASPAERVHAGAPVRPSRLRPLGLAAAAALLLACGIWLGRALGERGALPDTDSGLVEVETPVLDPGAPEPAPRGVPDALSPRGSSAGTLVADQQDTTPRATEPAPAGLRRLEPGEIPLHAQAELEVFLPEWQGPGRWLRLPPERGEQPASLIEAGPAIR